jgi:hypothetical protein
MHSKTIAFDDGEARAALTVRASTMLIETKHTYLSQSAMQVAVDDPVQGILRRYTMPDYLACTEGTLTVDGTEYQVESAKTPLPFDVFFNLPVALASQWGEAVYELNPHWLPVEQVEAKKEAATSTDASSA